MLKQTVGWSVNIKIALYMTGNRLVNE